MKKSFILHLDSLVILDKMTDEQAGKFIKLIYEYQKTGKIQKLDFAMEMAITPFLNQFKRDSEKYESTVERNRRNGSKGGRPKEDRVCKSLSGKKIPKHSDSFWVYLLKDESSGEIKIGETANLHNRRQTIKRSSYDLVYIDFFEVKSRIESLAVENEFKNEFKDFKISGDWFEMSQGNIEKAIRFLKSHRFIKYAKKADNDSDSESVNDNYIHKEENEKKMPKDYYESKELFLSWWNTARKKILNVKHSNYNTIPIRIDFDIMCQNYTQKDIKNAIIGLMKQKGCNDRLKMSPKHFLNPDYFETYLDAYHNNKFSTFENKNKPKPQML